jgi:O-antigen ligase
MILFYLLIGIMPLVRHSLWSETIVAGLTLNKYLGLLCLGLAIFKLLSRPRTVGFLQTTQARLFLVFCGLVTVSFVLRGPSIPLDDSPLTSFVSFGLLFFMTHVLIDSAEVLHRALLWLVGGMAFASLHTIREWQQGGMLDGRPGWVAGDPNYFAFGALLAMPIALVFASGPWPRWQRWLTGGCLVVILFAFVLAGSRGGFIGLLASFLLLAWRSPRRASFLTLGGVALGLLLVVAPVSPIERFLAPTAGDIESNRVRSALLAAGLRMVADNPVFGVGAGNYKPLVRMYGGPDVELRHLAHNTYLEVAAEHGLPGLALLLCLFGTTVLSGRRIARRLVRPEDERLRLAVRGIEVGLSGGMVAMLFLSIQHVRLLWFLVILASRLPALVGQERAGRVGALAGAPRLDPHVEARA